MEQRLQKLLAAAGVASRREAENLITAGRVAVDGTVVTQLGVKVDADLCSVTVDGNPIDPHPALVYVALNKPRGYASTRRDPHAPRVVTELVRQVDASLFPVGRLDVDTEGLLILTNDGDFAFRLTHPRHRVPKTYRAEVTGTVADDTIRRLEAGVSLEDGPALPAGVKLVRRHARRATSVVELTLTEGRKREVRRMLSAVGHPVVSLTRVSIGNLELGNLKPGQWRFLSRREVDDLLASAA